jgi:hypothetical protein
VVYGKVYLMFSLSVMKSHIFNGFSRHSNSIITLPPRATYQTPFQNQVYVRLGKWIRSKSVGIYCLIDRQSLKIPLLNRAPRRN